MKNVSLKSLIKEASLAKYEDFQDALMTAKNDNNYREFERLISDALKRKQWEWFGRFYAMMDGNSKALTKEIFKKVTPF